MSSKTILCMATSPEDEPIPLFLGREGGTVEKYVSITDADLGRPSLILRGHTKAVTAISAVTSDEIYTCSLDGTVKQWNAEMEFDGRRILRNVETKTPLRCLVMNDGRVYTGGQNGSFFVLDGDRKAIFNGHKGAVTAIAVTADGLVVTGGEDNHVRVWDISLGKTIRLLMGHTNAIKCLVLVEDEEDDESRGAILSFSRDRTMKVWTIPDPQDAQNEEEAVDEEKKSFMVSFQEPKEDDGEAKEEGKEGEAPSAGEAADAEKPAAAADPETPTTADGQNAEEDEDGQRRLSDGAPIKSALKTKEKQAIRRDEALSTIELPEAPHCSYQEEESSVVYIGATGGYIYGIQAKTIATHVLKFVARNKSKVRKEVKEKKQTVKRSIALYKRECRKVIKTEEKKHLRIARRTQREKKKKEREERKKQREEKMAERAAKRAQKDEDEEDEEEEDEEGDDGDEEEEEEEEEEENQEDEEDEEDEESRLKILSDEQRAEFKKFVEEKEKIRDEKIKALEAAFAAHMANIEPLAKSTYDQEREKFHRLHWTTYTKVGKEGTLALTSVSGKVYAAQGDRVIPTTVQRGVTVLQ